MTNTITYLVNGLAAGLHTQAGWLILLSVVLLASLIGWMREEQGK